MSIVLTDSFEEIIDTPLQDHLTDQSQAWVIDFGSLTVKANENKVIASSTGGFTFPNARVNYSIPQSHYEVEGVASIDINTASQIIGIVSRKNVSNVGYALLLVGADTAESRNLSLVKLPSTFLITNPFPFEVNQDYNFRLVTKDLTDNNIQIQGYLNNHLYIQYTDNDSSLFNTPGNVGLGGQLNMGSTAEWKDLKVKLLNEDVNYPSKYSTGKTKRSADLNKTLNSSVLKGTKIGV